jgi:MOSC domain-containing protein YiiM
VSGHIHQINTSPGGVPKTPVDVGYVTDSGIRGDGHNDRVHHGGPDAALCLFSLEVIEEMQGEGHPIFPGAAGENLTLSGVDWSTMVPGSRWRLGDEVEIEVTRFTTPCQKNAAWFTGGDFMRMHQGRHPGSSRVYARVLASGKLRPGDTIAPL